MKGSSHAIIGTSLTVAGLIALDPFPEVGGLLSAGIGAIPAAVASYLVDIDIKGSKAGKKVHWLSDKSRWVALCAVAVYSITHFALHYDNPIILKATCITAIVALVSWIFTKLEHRGPTHSLAVPVAFYFLWQEMFKGFSPYTDVACISFIAGYTLHILADMLNGKGCPIIWPLSSSKVHIMDIAYDGIGEKVVCGISLIIAIVLILYKFNVI